MGLIERLRFNSVARQFDGAIKHVPDILENSDVGIHAADLNSVTKTQKAFVNKPVLPNIDVFISLPKTEDDLAEVITNFDAVQMAKRELVSTNEILDTVCKSPDSVVAVVNKEASIDGFVEVLSQSNSPYVAIIGHNNSGNFRMYGAGEKSIDIATMSELCVFFSKRCLFLSCNSKDFVNSNDIAAGMMWELSYLQAANIVEDLSKTFKNKSKLSLSDAKAILFQQEINIHIKPKVKFIITSGTVTGGGVAGISYVNDKYRSESILTNKSSGRKQPRR